MLDEAEYAGIARLFQQCMAGPARPGMTINGRFLPVVREYERLTGMPGCRHNAVMHHRISLYGEPCARCGKPLRTPQARYCADRNRSRISWAASCLGS